MFPEASKDAPIAWESLMEVPHTKSENPVCLKHNHPGTTCFVKIEVFSRASVEA